MKNYLSFAGIVFQRVLQDQVVRVRNSLKASLEGTCTYFVCVCVCEREREREREVRNGLEVVYMDEDLVEKNLSSRIESVQVSLSTIVPVICIIVRISEIGVILKAKQCHIYPQFM